MRSGTARLHAKLEDVDARSDAAFEPALKAYFADLGDDSEDDNLADGLDDFYDRYEGFRDTLEGADGRALIILVPF